MTFKPAPPALVERFLEATGPLPNAQGRKMFGYPCVFVGGQMMSGLMEDRWFLRLGEEERAALLNMGAKPFQTSPGRFMREYVELPDSLLDSPRELSGWLLKSHTYVSGLPPKAPKRRLRKS